ncbi:Mitochondrial import inner membrane translocase subunit TIM44-1 [Porphyridium purpureum]|uniref:Mitochondrial import inner membrane translocase subunit TIM44-1 n=1 Tax=Porphyridium purpureum TaxID=35688 RepID=A0A5J4YXA9_PORPP|nr:Mitochondrial import inner membrane translocase subunit TIM44-1 [Porphyridium purpureum]|eukprot:POR7906..scf209_3
MMLRSVRTLCGCTRHLSTLRSRSVSKPTHEVLSEFASPYSWTPRCRFVCSAPGREKETVEGTKAGSSSSSSSAEASAGSVVHQPGTDPEDDAEGGAPKKRGVVGGFVRGLMGGSETAAEDEYISEARKAGVHIEPHRSELVATRRRRRADEEEGASAGDGTSIRDRLFSRFGGSAFIKGALDAKERISERVEESDNPIINFFRNVYDRFFAENEMGQVIREIRVSHPNFRISDFLREVEHETIPRVMDAYLRCDEAVLKENTTEDAYRMLLASIKERKVEGIEIDPTILSVDDVSLTAARFLDDLPVLIVSFSVQQINCLRDRSGNIIEGKEDDIRAVYYLWAMIQDHDLDEELFGDSTAGKEEAAGGAAPRDTGKETEGASEESSNSAGASATEDPQAKKESESESTAEDTKQERRKGWKIMEMVIRGAHSTI